MPDHLHALVEGVSRDSDFVEFVRRFKQMSGHAFRRRTGGSLWRRSYFDRTIRNDAAEAVVIRYIVNNPRVAGLVDRIEDYPHWGSGQFSREELSEFVATSCRMVNKPIRGDPDDNAIP